MTSELKPKYKRPVQFIFQLAPNLLDGVEVWTLRGSPSFLVPAIVHFMGICNVANSTKTTEIS